MSSRIILVFSLILVFATRFYGLTWGGGYYFHPDENNIATALSQLSPSNLHPHFFAYGQFPIYLGYLSQKLLSLPSSFSSSVLILRCWSAIFAVLSVYILFLIGQQLLPQTKFLFLYLLIFSPGLIQLAHFGTTESFLILVFSLNLYFAVKFLARPQSSKIFFLLVSLTTGLGLATKLSAAIFLVPYFLVCFYHYRFKSVPYFFSIILFSLLISFIFSPYNFLAWPDFISSMKYETAVATGQFHVFYTTQFRHTLPYLYQLVNIFPYTSGLPVFVFGSLGFLIYLCRLKKLSPAFHLVVISVAAYFLYFGQVYTKWTRFVSPIFFIFPFFTAYLFSFFPKLKLFFGLLCLIPGILFLQLYLVPDTRVQASDWLIQNLPSGSRLLSEAGNVISLPLKPHQLNVTDFDFYNLDNDNSLKQTIPQLLASTDFILLPSQRIIHNQNNSDFPFTQKYYHYLATQFSPLKTFSVNIDWPLQPELAEETWSVFDHPQVKLFIRSR